MIKVTNMTTTQPLSTTIIKTAIKTTIVIITALSKKNRNEKEHGFYSD